MIPDTFTAAGAISLKINQVIYANKYHYTSLFVKEKYIVPKKYYSEKIYCPLKPGSELKSLCSFNMA
jgi:hypothetical protein